MASRPESLSWRRDLAGDGLTPAGSDSQPGAWGTGWHLGAVPGGGRWTGDVRVAYGWTDGWTDGWTGKRVQCTPAAGGRRVLH